MKVAVVLLVCVFGFAACNPGQSLTDVIAQVVADTDINNDGIISETEFREELLARWDSDIPSDDKVSKNDFVHQWTSTYGDNHHDAGIFFDNLDAFFVFGELAEIDLAFHLNTLDPNNTGQVTVEAFGNFIRANHPCGQHGHLGC